MTRLALTITGLLFYFVSNAQAVTVDEIIRLKHAGVSESTIQMLIDRDGTSKAAGTWRTKDGWIVQSTDTREPQPVFTDGYQFSYPISVYPQVLRGRR